MAESDMKTFSQLRVAEITSPKKGSNINDKLNTDCLISIFKFLPLKDILNVENVCRTWKSLRKRFWYYVTEEDINDYYRDLQLQKNKKETKKLINLLIRKYRNLAGKLLLEGKIKEIDCVKLAIEIMDAEDLFIEETINVPNKINEFQLSCTDISETTLSSLYKNNTQIKNICFKWLNFGLKLNTSSLNNLNVQAIESLILVRCTIDIEENFKNFLSNLINLKKLVMRNSLKNLNPLEGLIRGKVNKLTEITLLGLNKNNFEEFDLDPLLSQQGELLKIHFDCIPEDLIKVVVSLKFIEEIRVETLSGNFIKCISLIKTLKTLEGKINYCQDEDLSNLAKCVNLKKLRIFIEKFVVSDEAISNFSKFENIEVLDLTIDIRTVQSKSSSKILLQINHCKKLQKLMISGIKSIKGILELEDFLNLKLLKIKDSYVSNTELANFLLKSPRLKDFFVENCKNINNRFVDLVNVIKTDNHNNYVLNLEFKNVKIETKNLNNISPLIVIRTK